MFNKRIIFWSSCLGMMLFGITLIVLGSIAPDLKIKLGLDEIEAGTLFSILPLGILAGSLLFGPVADKYGYKLLIVVSCFLLSAGFEGIAFTSSSDIMKGFIFLIGISGGAINGATNALVSDISRHDKTANISLLGVFFGVGALGMPLILGILGGDFMFEKIVATVGILSFITALVFAVIKLPPPKIADKIPLNDILQFFRDKVLILIAIFLFFQSSFEGLMNNWTTTYLADHLLLSQEEALFGLSLFVAGMVIMRLLTGTILRNVQVKRLIIASFALIIIALVCIKSEISDSVALSGFMLAGAGLAGGFPIMLGFVGARYEKLSGTAFSFVLTVALIGNMVINFLMGVISERSGISHLLTIIFFETIVMIMLCLLIIKKYKD